MADESDDDGAHVRARASTTSGRAASSWSPSEADDVRIHGVDGTEVRVVAPADGAGIETDAQPGRFAVRTLRQVGFERIAFVGLKVGRREFGFPLGFRVSGTIELEVPRDARVEVGSRPVTSRSATCAAARPSGPPAATSPSRARAGT